MNKKLIAVALAALPVAAMADVTLYGKIKMGVENTKTGEASSINHIDDIGSRIGFKGNEDLGNGLKAIWQVEQKVTVDEPGNRGFATRDSFLGFQGDFGKVRLGRLSNYQNDSMEDVDPWEYSSIALGLGTFTRNDTRYNNAIAYDSPEFAGLSGRVLYGVDETRTAKVGGGRTNKDTWNVGLGYKFDAFFAKYSYIRQNDRDITGDKADTSHRVEAGYNANNLYVALGYQQTKSAGGRLSAVSSLVENASGLTLIDIFGPSATSVQIKDREAALTVGYTIGALTPYISLAKGWDAKADGQKVDNTGYKQYVIGAQYALSKRTQVGATYGNVNFDEGKDLDVRAFGVNAVHAF